MTAPAAWQGLHRQVRAERRRVDGPAPAASVATSVAVSAAANAAASAARAPTIVEPEVTAAVVDPDVIAARLAAVRDVSPRLHARLAALDPAQQAAVLADEPAALVRAQVGSGKTTVLVHKALHLHLVGGVPLDRIAILTFTTKAADELRLRLDELAGRPTTPAERWLMGTFHSVAMALLQRVLPVEQVGHRPDFTVLDEDAVAALIDELAARHRLRVGRRRTLRDRLRALAPGDVTSELARLAALVAAAKRARNAMDFDDLIDHAGHLLAAADVPRPRFILVDELQDCEPRELELVRRLRGPAGRFFGVGDPRQAIYGWRGGRADGFARAAVALDCVVHALPASYRSTRTILDGARAVLGAQPVAGGELVGVRPPGAPIVVRRHHDPVAESSYLAARLAALHADGVPYGELAVLCRLRAQLDAIGPTLTAHGVPWTGDGEGGEVGAGDGVRLLTLHAAKGLEFRHVLIAGANLGVLPLVIRDQIDDEAEERRLLFVGLTRARDSVEISYVACPHQFGAMGVPSPLLYLLPAAAVEWHDGSAPTVASPSVASAPPAASTTVIASPVIASPPPAASPAIVASSSVAPSAVVEPAPAASVAAVGPDAPWRAGQAVRHPRYGVGVVVGLAGDAVECDFGKLGPRSFPLRMCPLVAIAGAPP